MASTNLSVPIEPPTGHERPLWIWSYRLSIISILVVCALCFMFFTPGAEVPTATWCRTMYRSVHDRIFSLPDDCLLYPAHDYCGLTVTSVAEERRFNPRLGGEIAIGDFAGYMKNLRLAHPKLLDVAVPANLRCGRPENETALAADPRWVQLHYNFAGMWEIDPRGLEEHVPEVQVLDVREPDEFTGPLGHIPGRARRRVEPRPPDRRRLPGGQPFSPGHFHPAAERIYRYRQFGTRHAALAC
jgi:glyoxylase-like metal-dependent hydrolase (beta-lactamase superfamily II)